MKDNKNKTTKDLKIEALEIELKKMTNPHYTYKDYEEGYCTYHDYFKCLPKTKLQLGKEYDQDKGNWSAKKYKIIYVNDHIALGIVTYCAIYPNKPKISYDLFDVNTGFRYNDARLNYQLKDINETSR